SLAAARRATRFRNRLPIPRELTGSDLTIRVKPARIQILPGQETRMWTYGGSFPGPTIRRPAGKATTVTFKHRLPRSAGKLSIHLHGGHSPAVHDGQPGGPAGEDTGFFCDFDPGPAGAGNAELIAPGTQRRYHYPGREDGSPERGSFQWYHDHRCGNAGRNVWRGLAGMWITDEPAVEDPLNLPSGARDLPLMIVDRQFNGRNQLTNPFANPGNVPFDQVTGSKILVNGAITPFAPVAARRYRLRLLNASNFRAYNLRFANDLPMTQIATESGLMPVAVRRSPILIGPGERVEVIVDFAGMRGRRLELQSVARADGANEHGSKPYQGPIMQFRVGDQVVQDSTSTDAQLETREGGLRPLPAWVADASPTPSFSWTVSVSGGIRPRWLINGETFDPSRVQRTVQLGQVVTWELRNPTAVAHLMHLHHTDWYMLSRNGEAPPAHEQCLKETFFLDPDDSIVVAGKMSDHRGKYVVHCHMLEHEDHGLMSQFKVV
ncbi:MAG: multicopper oxidase family protein, partial [Actinomycetota bacterium]|nr:multicopper oxidase family protein [Actinomycetota bacterium]